MMNERDIVYCRYIRRSKVRMRCLLRKRRSRVLPINLSLVVINEQRSAGSFFFHLILLSPRARIGSIYRTLTKRNVLRLLCIT